MTTGAFFVGLIVVVGLALAVFVTPILLIPAALIVLLALFSAPLLLLWSRVAPRRSGMGQSGESADTGYDPVDEPQGLTPRGGD